jgi:rsbT co-antagonist protein RsbR
MSDRFGTGLVTPRVDGAGDALDITDKELERRKRYLDLGEDDEHRLTGIHDLAGQYVQPVIDAFYEHLMAFEEARGFFDDQQVLERVKRRQKSYFIRLTQGDYDRAYARERLHIGAVHERIGLGIELYLGSYNLYLREVAGRLFQAFPDDPGRALAIFLSLMKLVFLDIGLAIDTYVHQRERTINRQQDAIRQLSTPVLQLREGLLLMPIVGEMEGERARQLTRQLLASIRDRRARVVVLDVTGVPSIDSNVANHLLRTVDAARLMGATSIVTGISTEVAETLVGLGLGLESLTTVGDLQGGIEHAQRLLDRHVVSANGVRPAKPPG